MNKKEKKAYNKKYYEKNKDKPEFKEKRKAYGTKYYNEHPEKEKARHKKYRDEHKEEKKAYGKKYYKKHRKEKLEYSKKYYEEHPEEEKARNKKWKKENKDKPEFKEKRKAIDHKRRARINGNGGSYTIEEITKLRKETKGICKGWKREPHYVGDKNLTIDHRIPLSRGGYNDIRNIQLLCFSCNSSKGAK